MGPSQAGLLRRVPAGSRAPPRRTRTPLRCPPAITRLPPKGRRTARPEVPVARRQADARGDPDAIRWLPWPGNLGPLASSSSSSKYLWDGTSCPRAWLHTATASRAPATRLVRLVRRADEMRKLREPIVAEHLTQLRIGLPGLLGHRVLRERPARPPLSADTIHSGPRSAGRRVRGAGATKRPPACIQLDERDHRARVGTMLLYEECPAVRARLAGRDSSQTSVTPYTASQSTPLLRGRYPALSMFLGIDHLVTPSGGFRRPVPGLPAGWAPGHGPRTPRRLRAVASLDR